LNVRLSNAATLCGGTATSTAPSFVSTETVVPLAAVSSELESSLPPEPQAVRPRARTADEARRTLKRFRLCMVMLLDLSEGAAQVRA
jgi:hypothetical protein